MLYKHFGALKAYYPFQPKRLVRFSWISLIFISLCISTWANDDVQQIKVEDSRQLIKQAEKLARKGDLIEAEKLLRQAIAQNTGDSKPKLSLSYILLKQRRFNESYGISIEIAKAESTNSRAYALVGLALLNLGNFHDAQLILENSLRIKREESLGWFGLGMLDFYENRIQKSVNKLEGASYLEPDDPDMTFALAQVYARAEKYKEAADTYNKFLQISPASDKDRRDRIKGLISFLSFLGNKQQLYTIDGGAKQSILPIEILRDRPIIEVKINNKEEKLRFVLDTGSGISVISEETAKRLKINEVSRGGSARAVGGNGKFDIVYGFLKSINFGDVKIRNIPVYIRKFHDDAEKIDGYIGLSLISKFLTTVDYGNATFTLVKKDDQTVENVATEEIALPLRLTSSGFLSGEVQLNGIETPLNFIVDTGASISVISNELASTEQMSQCSIAEKMRVIGAAGITENVSSFMLPKVTFGTHSRESIKAIALNLNIINEASGFEQAGILGGNFLKNYRLTFDFQKSKVTFVPNNK
jgi:predicted aspartyl protease/thioredoxin-like negative regulator of GroEL